MNKSPSATDHFLLMSKSSSFQPQNFFEEIPWTRACDCQNENFANHCLFFASVAFLVWCEIDGVQDFAQDKSSSINLSGLFGLLHAKGVESFIFGRTWSVKGTTNSLRTSFTNLLTYGSY